MKKTLLIICSFFSCYIYADLYDENQKKLDDLDEKITDKAFDTGFDLGSFAIAAGVGFVPGMTYAGIRTAYDGVKLIRLLNERYNLTKDIKEKQAIRDALDKLEHEEGNMNEYRADHADEGSHSSEPDCVGGLRD